MHSEISSAVSLKISSVVPFKLALNLFLEISPTIPLNNSQTKMYENFFEKLTGIFLEISEIFRNFFISSFKNYYVNTFSNSYCELFNNSLRIFLALSFEIPEDIILRGIPSVNFLRGYSEIYLRIFQNIFLKLLW